MISSSPSQSSHVTHAGDELREVNQAIDEFEDAVKRHEHIKLLDSEVSLRQDIDRARERLLEAVKALVSDKKAV
ncbi:MAG: hypothetical protein ACE5FJ_06720 [Gemmatimonadales bacterium]